MTAAPRVSVIVPVYNAEKTLRRAVASLLRQRIPQREMEILLVDDGSTDGSPEMCDALAKRHRHIRVLHQPNGGVSAARNAAIRAARGACLLFLDADDTLEPHTAPNVVSFWEAHRAAVDVVTYPLTYRSERGARTPHLRNARFGGTGIYPLAEYPLLCQSTMNICISNLGTDTPLFSEGLENMEDQAFLTGLLLRKKALGFVREAGYCYLRHRGNATLRLCSAYAPQMAVLRAFLADSKRHPDVAPYLHNLILYNLDRLLQVGTLFPDPPGSKAWQADRAEVSALLTPIPLSLLLSYPFWQELHRYYFLRLKPGLSFSVEAGENALSLRCDGLEIYRTETMDLALTRYDVQGPNEERPSPEDTKSAGSKPSTAEGWNGPQRGDILQLQGFLRSPLFDFTEAPRLFLKHGEEIPLSPSPYSRWKAREETNRLWGFDLPWPLTGEARLAFSVALDGPKTLPVTLSALPSTGFLPARGQTRLLRGGWLLSFGTQALAVSRGDAKARKAYRGYLRGIRWQLLRTAPHLWAIHLAGRCLRRLLGRPWVYVAAPEDESGAAARQWRHDAARGDGIRRFLVGGEGIPFGSVRHLLLLLSAGTVRTERSDAPGYLPCAEETFARFSDLYDFTLAPLDNEKTPSSS